MADNDDEFPVPVPNASDFSQRLQQKEEFVLFVKNISPNFDEETVGSHFSSAGTVSKVHFLASKPKAQHKKGFVTFTTLNEPNKAIELLSLLPPHYYDVSFALSAEELERQKKQSSQDESQAVIGRLTEQLAAADLPLRKAVRSQLEDERRKIEDQQFRIEDEDIVKSELESQDESQAVIGRLTEQLAAVDLERKAVRSQLEDERRKIEGQQFRIEEEDIVKSELEATNERNLRRIQELENLLEAESQRSKTLDKLSEKEFESQELLTKYKEEIENLQASLEEAKKELSNSLSRYDTNLEELAEENRKAVESEEKVKGKVEQQLNETRDELGNALLRHEKEIRDLKEELDANTKSLSEVNSRFTVSLESAKAELEEEKKRHEEKLNALNSSSGNAAKEIVADRESSICELKIQIEILESELSQKVAALETERVAREQLGIERSTLAKVVAEKEALTTDLKFKIESLESELSQKVAALDIERISREQFFVEQAALTEKLNRELESVRAELSAKSAELDAEVLKLSESHGLCLKDLTDKYEAQMSELGVSLKASQGDSAYELERILGKVKEAENLKDEVEEECEALKQKIESLEKELTCQKETFRKQEAMLEDELDRLKSSLEGINKEKSELASSNSQLQAEISLLTASLESHTSRSTQLESDLTLANNMLASSNQSQKSLQEEKADLKAKLEASHEATKLKGVEVESLSCEVAASVEEKKKLNVLLNEIKTESKALGDELARNIKELVEKAERLANNLEETKEESGASSAIFRKKKRHPGSLLDAVVPGSEFKARIMCAGTNICYATIATSEKELLELVEGKMQDRSVELNEAGVGDFVYALWGEGKFYRAVVKKVLKSGWVVSGWVVLFVDFDNTETVCKIRSVPKDKWTPGHCVVVDPGVRQIKVTEDIMDIFLISGEKGRIGGVQVKLSPWTVLLHHPPA